MNIMLFSNSLYRDGISRYIEFLATELTRRGHHVTVVSTNNDAGIGKEGSGVTFLSVPCKPSPNMLSIKPHALMQNLPWLRKVIRERDIQVVHCNNRRTAMYMQFCRVFLRVSCPYVYTLHLTPVPASFIHRTMSFMGERAIAISSEARRFMIEKLRLPAQKIVTVFNGADYSQLAPLSPEERERVYHKMECGGGGSHLKMSLFSPCIPELTRKKITCWRWKPCAA